MLCKEILEKLPKPSDFIDNMVAGLRRNDLNIKIDMSTYGSARFIGDWQEPICVGCAATRSLYNMFGKVASKSDIRQRTCRAKFFKIDRQKLEYFELAVDFIRQGSEFDSPALALERFYGYTSAGISLPEPEGELPLIGNDFTASHLHLYSDYANRLREAGY